jgi:hypothetical protein
MKVGPEVVTTVPMVRTAYLTVARGLGKPENKGKNGNFVSSLLSSFARGKK